MLVLMYKLQVSVGMYVLSRSHQLDHMLHIYPGSMQS